jgi:hypothetical protein
MAGHDIEQNKMCVGWMTSDQKIGTEGSAEGQDVSHGAVNVPRSKCSVALGQEARRGGGGGRTRTERCIWDCEPGWEI